jgi:predicted nucleic acid-binding protein
LLITVKLGLKAAYDAYYLALAESLKADFWTADQRLTNAVAEKLPWVKCLGAY